MRTPHKNQSPVRLHSIRKDLKDAQDPSANYNQIKAARKVYHSGVACVKLFFIGFSAGNSAFQLRADNAKHCPRLALEVRGVGPKVFASLDAANAPAPRQGQTHTSL
jgi:hypothetical protein